MDRIEDTTPSLQFAVGGGVVVVVVVVASST